jgi:WD repeat-containing protein 35
MTKLPAKDPLLNEIGMKFMAAGSHQQAVDAFLKLGDSRKAVDACVHLNQWTAAVALADAHSDIDKRALMGRYAQHLAENSHIAAAINVLHTVDLPREAAEVLDKEGDNYFKQTRRYVFAKKCFVFAAEMLQVFAERDPSGRELMEKAWRKAEAVHFLLLAHRQMSRGEWEDALYTATRVYSVYPGIVGKERAAALLGICGFNSGYLRQCSTGFIHLENTPMLTKRKKDKISRIAVRIFGKQPPNDPQGLPSFPCKKCKRLITAPACRCPCGFVTVPSIASGKAIRAGVVWKCPSCRHFALQEEIAGSPVCPLCHTRVAGA